MRKFQYIIAFVSVCLLASCTDFLNTSSQSYYTPDVVFSSPAYTNQAVMGIYDLLCTDQTYSSRLSLTCSTNSDIEFAGADETSYAQAGSRGVSNYLITADYGDQATVWQNLYSIIERSNECIKYIPSSPATSGSTESQMMGYYGEALTLRALAYFELVRMWGDVPFTTEPANPDGSNFYLPATDRDSIYEHIIDDLGVAEQYVPWVGGNGNYNSVERVTKGFVKGLRARMCLARGGYSIRNTTGYPTVRGSDWQKYYQIAYQECSDIINSGSHSLDTSYVDIWQKVNGLTVNNQENLFEVALGLGHSGEMGYSIGLRFYANPKYGYGNNANVVNTSAYYFYMFDPKDLRRDITIDIYTYSNSSAVLQEFLTQNPLSFNIGKWDPKWMSSSWLSQNLNANGKVGYGINWIMMRMSDVYLMRAEISNDLNGAPTAESKQDLTAVRKRAFYSSDYQEKVAQYVDSVSTSHDAFFNAIVNERAYEFGGEGIRKWDLVRWNLLMSKIQYQRDMMKAMLYGDAPYDHLPTTLYYQFNSDGTINLNTINYYTNLSAAPDTTFQSTQWLSGITSTSTPVSTYVTRVNLFSSGLTSPSGVTNRYVYPIPTVVLSTNFNLKQGYGF